MSAATGKASRPPPGPSGIVVQRAVAARGVPAAGSLRSFATAALPRRHGELTIRIVDARESRALNRSYRGKDKPTNVLSFGYDGGVPAPAAARRGAAAPALGDLVICAPVVAREALEQRKPLRAHWAHMVVHGCLHLCGYDHEDEADAQRMEARETKILELLGFPDPYQ